MKNNYRTVIPDDQLEAYLADKLTERPFYGFETEVVNLSTEDWLNRLRKQDEERKRNNANITRGLKR